MKTDTVQQQTAARRRAQAPDPRRGPHPRHVPLIRELVRRLHQSSGFTLIELLVSMLVLGIAVAAIATVIATTYSRSNLTTAQSVSQTAARAAVDTAVSDLRQTYYGDVTTSRIVSMSPTALTFYSPDRAQPTTSTVPTFHLRQIAYRLNGGVLERAVATSTNTNGPPWTGLTFGPWMTEVSSVTNTTVFTYQDATGAPTSDPKKVSRITITLQVNPAGSSSYVYQSSATIRAEA